MNQDRTPGTMPFRDAFRTAPLPVRIVFGLVTISIVTTFAFSADESYFETSFIVMSLIVWALYMALATSVVQRSFGAWCILLALDVLFLPFLVPGVIRGWPTGGTIQLCALVLEIVLLVLPATYHWVRRRPSPI